MKNQGNRNNVLYIVFHKLSDDTSYFSNEPSGNFAIFDKYNSFIVKLKKNVLIEAHKKN